MSIAENLTKIAENQQKVFDAGWKRFLKAFTNNNNRALYTYAFRGSDFSGLKFDPAIKPTSGEGVFLSYEGEYIPEGVDFSNIENTSTSAQFTCRYAAKLKEFPDLNWGVQERYGGTWQGCTLLETIAVIRCNENTIFPSAFSGCSGLINVTFDGIIGQNDLNFTQSTKLSDKSLIDIVSHLKDYSGDTSGTQHTITLGSANIAKLEATPEGEAAIAEATDGKGWTLT